MNYFSSPKSRVIIITTTIFLIIIFGVVFIMIWDGQKMGWPAWYVVLFLFIGLQSVLIPFLCYLYAPIGYIITQDTIVIKRPLKNNISIPTAKVKRVWCDPDAFKGTIRACGNGGLFGSVGWFYSKALGDFRAYITDMGKAVIIAAGERYVISPDDADPFMAALNKKIA